MCARYELNDQPTDIAARFGLVDLPPRLNRDTVRPTDQALIVGMNGEAALFGWGFEVTWDKKPLINGRSETLLDKPTFRPHLENRCIVPATAYFEWRSENGAKLKNKIRPSDQATFSMAGLVQNDRFVILTCQPSPTIAHIHSRMPVILSPAAEMAWLNPSLDFDAVVHTLTPYDQSPMTAEETAPPVPKQRDLFN